MAARPLQPVPSGGLDLLEDGDVLIPGLHLSYHKGFFSQSCFCFSFCTASLVLTHGSERALEKSWRHRMA